MTSLTDRRITYTLARLVACMLLTSCVIPGPPHNLGMRGNLGERLPDFIVPGVTTREDVLMHLGEPDSRWKEGSELHYVSRSYGGGVAVILPLPGPPGFLPYSYDREVQRALVVEFDEAGIVNRARLETETCSEHMYFGRSCVTIVEPAASGDTPKADGCEPKR